MPRFTTVLLLGSLVALNPMPTVAQTALGSIAYVRGSDRREIHVIDPNAANDRTLWRAPRPAVSVDSLVWSPNGAELAFSSDHEQACSTFESDIFVLTPARTVRRVTNAPACADLADRPKASVTVHLENRTPTSDNFFVYVAGAPEVQPMPLGPFGTGTLTFDDVAVLGDDVLQEIVVTNGTYRWTDPARAVQVRPADAVDAGTFVIYEGGGLKLHGAYNVVWRGDGSRISFGVGVCGAKYETPADAGPGGPVAPVLNVDGLACLYDRGPTPASANQVLYYDLGRSTVQLAVAGSGTLGETVLSGYEADFIHALQWLPDGSGFLFVADRLNDDIIWSGNIYEYSFATRKTTRLTSLVNEFANFFSVSPDGQWVVFERSREQYRTGPIELWVMRRNGSELRRLVADGQLPAWGSH
jgi:TolB protein